MFKKIFKYVFISLLGVLIIGSISLYIYLKNSAPIYEGEAVMKALKSDVTVKFDSYAIPHIYADNAEDAYRALGYVHAQERLFQMEMIRRLTAGTLAEILGSKLIKTDKFFRTLGIKRMAVKTGEANFENIEHDWQRHSLAYLEGINEFIDNGNTPLEFTILGIPKTEFNISDTYSILGYMGLGFSNALKDDPLMEKIRSKNGKRYLVDWVLDRLMTDSLVVSTGDKGDLGSLISNDIEAYLESASLPLWYGSNGWVVSPKKSSSGKVILANDTHIGISQPSVWYEAHMVYPGFDFYGCYLAGVPFSVVGHSRDFGWGLTIFPFDGIDMYREQVNPNNPHQLWENDKWVDMTIQNEVIKVKDETEVVFERKVSRHGPIINEVSRALDTTEVNPISFWWGFLDKPTSSLEAIHGMNHASNMLEMKASVSKIDFIGLNVLYGDREGNIAHWGSGHIPKRPAHVNPKFILDGASGNDEMLGYYDFSVNPMSENPESGYIASANNDPGMVNGNYFHGYYCPPNRYNRIVKHLESKEKWSQDEMKSIQLDEISDEHQQMAQTFSEVLKMDEDKFDEISVLTLTILENWNGGYELEQVGPVVFTKLLYHVMYYMMVDEVGYDDFTLLQGSYIYKGSLPKLVDNKKSIWWDDISTATTKESRKEIIAKAFEKTVSELKIQLGDDVNNWHWRKVHTITHEHPLGMQKPLDKFFNVGPYVISGGNDVPNKMMYEVDEDGVYHVNSSPALRVLLDFADVDASENINPTGQSGNVMSPHYKDQAEMFNAGVYRPQLMNEKVIDENCRKLVLKKK